MKTKIIQGILTFLIFILGILIGSQLDRLNFTKSQKNNNPSTPSSDSATSSTASSQNSEIGYENYTILEGDTLFGISLKFGISTDELAKFNNMTDQNSIKVGQIIKIPKTSTASGEAKIEIDIEKMQAVQEEVDKGSQPWRLDPVEVVKAEAPASYELNATDTYTLKSKDVVVGEAEVEVKKNKSDKIYTYSVRLVQPITKGDTGVWAIISIKGV